MKQNIIVALFNISSEAYQAFSELKAYSQITDALVAQAVLVKKENGLIIPAESTDFTANTAESAWTGGLNWFTGRHPRRSYRCSVGWSYWRTHRQ